MKIFKNWSFKDLFDKQRRFHIEQEIGNEGLIYLLIDERGKQYKVEGLSFVLDEYPDTEYIDGRLSEIKISINKEFNL